MTVRAIMQRRHGPAQQLSLVGAWVFSFVLCACSCCADVIITIGASLYLPMIQWMASVLSYEDERSRRICFALRIALGHDLRVAGPTSATGGKDMSDDLAAGVVMNNPLHFRILAAVGQTPQPFLEECTGTGLSLST
jgi:hypothetical protein